MERRMTITDFGKDYGFSRYLVEATGLKYNSNDYDEISRVVMCFGEPCEDCQIQPVDCPGLEECDKSYGRQ